MIMPQFTQEQVIQYCIDTSSEPSDIASELEKETREKVEMSGMLSGKLEGSLLGLLTRLSKAKRVLEFGTYTGYSALVFAENLPKDGEVHTIDINKETVEFGFNIIKHSEHFHKIHSHIGAAAEIAQSLEGRFDLVFIDADKENYINYLKIAESKLNPGGMVILDNALWGNNVLDDHDQRPSTLGIREVNRYISENETFYKTLLPIRDGVLVAIKR